MCMRNTLLAAVFPSVIDYGRCSVEDACMEPSLVFLQAHDGSTFFSEQAAAIGNDVDRRTAQAMRNRPVYTMSCDAADTDLAIPVYVVHPSTLKCKCLLLRIVEPASHTASAFSKL